VKIVVFNDYQQAFEQLACFARLHEHEVTIYHDTEQDPATLAARLEGADAVILTQNRTLFRRDLVSRLPASLGLIAQTGRSINHIDREACSERGILIAAAGLGLPYSTAELTWALILASRRWIPHEVEQLKQGRWQTTLGSGLHGRNLGIYSPGRIGSLVAQVGQAFGMRVICWGRESSLELARKMGYAVPVSRAAFFAEADVVCLHLPLNPTTHGIVTAEDLACMKPGALLVNSSRAELIQEGALLDALQKGRPGFAAVDVYEHEPILGGEHPLLKLPNVICTPHLGFVEADTYETYYGSVVDSLLGYAEGELVHVLNPEALDAKTEASSAARADNSARNEKQL
jgi:D-3-phosphoglycerate dehydrogenase